MSDASERDTEAPPPPDPPTAKARAALCEPSDVAIVQVRQAILALCDLLDAVLSDEGPSLDLTPLLALGGSVGDAMLMAGLAAKSVDLFRRAVDEARTPCASCGVARRDHEEHGCRLYVAPEPA